MAELRVGRPFTMAEGYTSYPECPAGDGKVLPGESARGSNEGTVWHDDCAEDAGLIPPPTS